MSNNEAIVREALKATTGAYAALLPATDADLVDIRRQILKAQDALEMFLYNYGD